MNAKQIIFSCFFLTFLSYNVFAASVLPLGLDTLQKDAEYIFHGQCISVHTAEDTETGLAATYVTFKVISALKGNLSRTHTIKQFGGAAEKDGNQVFVPGTPSFEIGKEYIVFLPKPSHLGFSSPIGLTQGMFTVFANKQGQTTVSNGRDFAELLKNVPASAWSEVALIKDGAKASPSSAMTRVVPRGTRMSIDDFTSILKEMEETP